MRRLTTMLAATALLAGGAGALPAQAAPDPGPATQAGATDPAGDAAGKSSRARAAADLRKVEYYAPSTPDGIMKFRFKFTKLHNGQKAGAPRQRAAALLVKRRDPSGLWSVEANNFSGEIKVRRHGENATTRITPESAKLKRTFKRGGVMVVTVSTEWLTAKRVDVDGFGISGQAFDFVRSMRLDVSGQHSTEDGTARVARETAPAAAYADCKDLNADWRNGVAGSRWAARIQVREGGAKPAAGERARAVYRQHKALMDLDRDGTACER